MTRKTKRILKGAIAGLAGGLAGSFAMNEFQGWWSKAAGKQNQNRREEPATVRAARTIAVKALHRRLPEARKNLAGELVHYAFGSLNGAMYGAFAERKRMPAAWRGALFGTALFVLADETLVPLLGWSRAPHKYPLRSHLYALASHLVYGATADTVRNAVRSSM